MRKNFSISNKTLKPKQKTKQKKNYPPQKKQQTKNKI